MLISGAVPSKVPSSLKVITYGTEIMDQSTLYDLCKLLPNVDFRQTYGMSELGIFRVKSEARDSLYMKVGGEGIKIREVDGVLQINSNSRMLGYLNAPSPFDAEGWFDTKDIVEFKNDYFKIIGRVSDAFNVGGLKFMASEVERVAITFPNVSLVKAIAKQNPITGQHVELIVQPTDSEVFDKIAFMKYLKERLQPHMVPKRIHIDVVEIGHRYKRS
jgi:acyl-CoA synthetase (AMP-forming)/AMP-acid ligase II